MPQPSIPALSSALELLRVDLTGLRPTRQHFVPDLALLGILNDVEEYGQLLHDVQEHQFCDRAFPIARAAYEAAQLSLLLATDPNYDLAGARAWVYYLKKDHDIAVRAREAYTKELGMTPEEWYEGAINEMQETWEALSPGKGMLLREAQVLISQQPRRPDNFLGVPIAGAIRDRVEHGFRRSGRKIPYNAAALLNNAYASASRDAHPRPRHRPTGIATMADGTVEVTLEDRDRSFQYDTAAILAAGSVRLAQTALRRRFRLPAT